MSGAVELSIQLAALAAGVTATLYLGRGALRFIKGTLRMVRQVVRQVDAAHDIVIRELEHNHGSSMKDDVYGTAVALGQAQRRIDEVERKVAHLEARLEHDAPPLGRDHTK